MARAVVLGERADAHLGEAPVGLLLDHLKETKLLGTRGANLGPLPVIGHRGQACHTGPHPPLWPRVNTDSLPIRASLRSRFFVTALRGVLRAPAEPIWISSTPAGALGRPAGARRRQVTVPMFRGRHLEGTTYRLFGRLGTAVTLG